MPRKSVKTPDAAPAGRKLVKKNTHISGFRKTTGWDLKFSARKRTIFSALGRMNKSNQMTHRATFKLTSDAASQAAAAGGRPDANCTLRFPVEELLMVVQQLVAREFKWKGSSALYLTDQHGWERPIANDTELFAAFAHWEETSGPRTRSKYDALFAEVEGLLTSAQPEEQLSGAGAAWEIACRDTHHKLLGEGFIEALHAQLTSGSFAPVTHAAAAVRASPCVRWLSAAIACDGHLHVSVVRCICFIPSMPRVIGEYADRRARDAQSLPSKARRVSRAFPARLPGAALCRIPRIRLPRLSRLPCSSAHPHTTPGSRQQAADIPTARGSARSLSL